MLWEFAATLSIPPDRIGRMKYRHFCRLEEQIWKTHIQQISSDEG